MAHPPDETARPEPEEVEAEPYDSAADRSAGARIHEAGSQDPTGPVDGSSNAWAMACHLSGLADFANVFFGLGILIPLVIWLARRSEDSFVDYHGKEAVNFQITVLFWTLVFAALSCCLIGIPFLVVLPIVETIFAVLAAIEAAGGRRYRYPLTMRLIP